MTSQNGYSANDRSVIASYTVPRTQVKIALRKGDVSVLLLDILAWIHLNIEPLDVGVADDWGYAERTIRGSSTTLSNHASGTAADANATQHPLGVRGTWTAKERNLINARLALYEGCIRWGDNYDVPALGGVAGSRVDGMHFEINRGAADCKRVADKIRAGQLAGPTAPTPVPRPRVPEDDAMYIKCQPDKTKPDVWTAIWNGPIFIGLGALGEIQSADLAIQAGATVQWVDKVTWDALDQASKAIRAPGVAANVTVDSTALQAAFTQAVGAGFDIVGSATPKQP